MQKNVGTTDAMIRITGGLLGLAYGIGRMSRRPYNTPWLLLSFSAMKVAEGVTRVCPMYKAMGVNTIHSNGMQNIVDKAKQKGIQAVMNQVTRSINMTGGTDKDQEIKGQAMSKDKTNHAETAHASANTNHTKSASTSRENEASRKPELTAEDEQLENAAREFISYRSQDKDEQKSNTYPTYS
ncbi:hypothetical protein BRE01_18210 [Brevibacillus reuszeri]|uniref:Inner membrane protein YgaP-like transmembrane domain-containing protein n=1 Tax=Brevibacillus reuszeri TaxID=54915 RepID=A0A0K9Z024_9BACL|nr:DUF2892 domain-containing protein [Brevibacillus reuszeri]KNB74304.1 hypothetical protein ADS79_00900 [Brevibacillus reuszeri]MED1856193.1 DUF2892 domain-containing protein [Brevibacillus reuszeri]GED68119.1 hypothetical protein BRE01_18210 [Brevibacillus reuszeri]